GLPAYGSATPQGIMNLLKAYDIPLSGLHAVVVGRSPILGRPMAMMLLGADCTVTVCHSRTRNLPLHLRHADLIVGAVGKPQFIQASWIPDHAIVIDAGYHPGGIGDIELAPLVERVKAYTPVPGGVGPMTIATLMEQTVKAAEQAS
ncbi:MAG: bifunctional 5,10-methylene-tetrahydrofolate dehydrogenase/5,10-methylene-tetrahydrofolate cyclohydrolase, partial [Pseudomonadales bacterium]|nr:bifunctional 5,10-methylene-tetrahydrofolate dehydrogenase/5,10-methylene-tetrahydrofolate cyclohydrolase [Pseudomonadales bacterium]